MAMRFVIAVFRCLPQSRDHPDHWYTLQEHFQFPVPRDA